MSEDWTEKYRPKTLKDVVGNDAAVKSLKAWAESWKNGIPPQRAFVLHGTPGVGKTSIAHALGNDMGWVVIEMNASDQRTGSIVDDIALRGSYYNSFSDDGSFVNINEGGMKLIIMEEADSINRSADAGGNTAIKRLIENTLQPVILTANDYKALIDKCGKLENKVIDCTVKKIQASTTKKVLKSIAEKEGTIVDDDALDVIVNNADGDLRSAIRSLESVAIGQTHVTIDMTDGISVHDNRYDIYDVVSAIFTSDDATKGRRIYYDSESDLSELSMWVDENMPLYYPDNGDRVRALEKMSRADFFSSKVLRRQYFGFWSYSVDMLTVGVNTSCITGKRVPQRISFPKYLISMSKSRSVRNIKKSLSEKLAVMLHTSSKRVRMDVIDPLKAIVKNDKELLNIIVDELELDENEVSFLIDAKSDSKEVADLLKTAQANRESRAKIKKAEEREIEKAETETKPNQKSIMDFGA